MKRATAFHAFSSLAIALIFIVPCKAQVAAKRFNFDSGIGIVLLTSDDGVCMQISNPNLKEGSHIKLVSLSRPQLILEASVLKKLDGMCRASGFQQGFDYYSLSQNRRQVGMPEIALAIVNPIKGMSIKKGLVSIDLDRDGRREYFRKCTSLEGAHLTVWSGQPLKGKRRWHYYYYLHYAAVQNCQKKDYMD